jgi:sulfur carrier protein
MTDVDTSSHAVVVSINGAPAHLATPQVAAALQHSGVSLDAKHVAVAVNDAVLPRAAWESATLVSGDRIEIITAVAGG